MLASFLFFIFSRQELSARFRPAMVMSALVVFITGYHYLRIFSSWHDAYRLVNGVYQSTGMPFNDAYRYVDWLLTVPLLCAEPPSSGAPGSSLPETCPHVRVVNRIRVRAADLDRLLRTGALNAASL